MVTLKDIWEHESFKPHLDAIRERAWDAAIRTKGVHGKLSAADSSSLAAEVIAEATALTVFDMLDARITALEGDTHRTMPNMVTKETET